MTWQLFIHSKIILRKMKTAFFPAIVFVDMMLLNPNTENMAVNISDSGPGWNRALRWIQIFYLHFPKSQFAGHFSARIHNAVLLTTDYWDTIFWDPMLYSVCITFNRKCIIAIRIKGNQIAIKFIFAQKTKSLLIATGADCFNLKTGGTAIPAVNEANSFGWSFLHE